MNIIKTISIASLTLVLGACAGGHQRPPRDMPPASDQFSTKITAGGLKIFHYTVSSRGPGGRGGYAGQQGGGPDEMPGGSNGGSMPGQMPDQRSGPAINGDKTGIQQMLLAKLSQTGYCRDGYIEISSSVSRGYSFIRGECREVASEEDRYQFQSSVDE